MLSALIHPHVFSQNLARKRIATYSSVWRERAGVDAMVASPARSGCRWSLATGASDKPQERFDGEGLKQRGDRHEFGQTS